MPWERGGGGGGAALWPWDELVHRPQLRGVWLCFSPPSPCVVGPGPFPGPQPSALQPSHLPVPGDRPGDPLGAGLLPTASRNGSRRRPHRIRAWDPHQPRKNPGRSEPPRGAQPAPQQQTEDCRHTARVSPGRGRLAVGRTLGNGCPRLSRPHELGVCGRASCGPASPPVRPIRPRVGRGLGARRAGGGASSAPLSWDCASSAAPGCAVSVPSAHRLAAAGRRGRTF